VANLTDIVALINMTFDRVPEPLLVLRYLDAAREFFRRTDAWRIDDPEFIAVTPYTDTYMIDMVDAELVDVRMVRWGDNGLLQKATREQIVHANDTSTTPARFRVTGGYMIVAPDPTTDISSSLNVGTASIRPTATADSLHDSIVDKFGEVLEQGTMARILSIPAKPWTDYAGATYFRALFESAIDYWTWRAADGDMKGVPRSIQYGGI